MFNFTALVTYNVRRKKTVFITYWQCRRQETVFITFLQCWKMYTVFLHPYNVRGKKTVFITKQQCRGKKHIHPLTVAFNKKKSLYLAKKQLRICLTLWSQIQILQICNFYFLMNNQLQWQTHEPWAFRWKNDKYFHWTFQIGSSNILINFI